MNSLVTESTRSRNLDERSL